MRKKLDLIMDSRDEIGSVILYRYNKSMYIYSIDSDILLGPIYSFENILNGRFIIAEERENDVIIEHILIEGKYVGAYDTSEVYNIINLIKEWLDCGVEEITIAGISIGRLLIKIHMIEDTADIAIINTRTNCILRGLYDRVLRDWSKEPSYKDKQ